MIPLFVAKKSFYGYFVGTIVCQSTMYNVPFFSPPEDNRSFLPAPKRDSRKFIDDVHYRNSSALLREPSSLIVDPNVGSISFSHYPHSLLSIVPTGSS